MENPQIYRGRIWKPSMMFAGTIYVLFGGFGVAAFGEHTDDIAMLNLRPSPQKTVLQTLYCSTLLLTIPLQALPVFQLIEKEYMKSKVCGVVPSRVSKTHTRHILYSILKTYRFVLELRLLRLFWHPWCRILQLFSESWGN